MATTRSNIKFSTKHHVFCNEINETATVSTHLPFTADTTYTIKCNELIESNSTTNILYDSSKNFTCRELVEGEITDYISMSAPTLSWTTGINSGTLRITNATNSTATLYYGTSNSISSITSGGYSLSAGASKDITIQSTNKIYYAYAKNTEWDLNSSVSTGCTCKLKLNTPSVTTVGTSISIVNNDSRTSVTPYIAGTAYSSISASSTGSYARSTNGSFTVYVANSSYTNSDTLTGYIIASPSITYSSSNVVTITNNSNYSCTLHYTGTPGGSIDSSVTLASGSTKTFSYTTSGTVEAYLYYNSYCKSSTTSTSVVYTAPSTTR